MTPPFQRLAWNALGSCGVSPGSVIVTGVETALEVGTGAFQSIHRVYERCPSLSAVLQLPIVLNALSLRNPDTKLYLIGLIQILL